METAGLKEFGEFRTRLASAAFGSFGEKKRETAALGACRRAVDAVWEAFRKVSYAAGSPKTRDPKGYKRSGALQAQSVRPGEAQVVG